MFLSSNLVNVINFDLFSAMCKVAIRVRPFNRREKELDTRRVVEVSGSKITLNKSSGSKRQHVFLFDSCFDSTDPQTDGYASQAVVFESIGSSILESAFKGFISSYPAWLPISSMPHV